MESNPISSQSENRDIHNDIPSGPLYTRNEYSKSFDTAAYLKDFYSQYNAEPAMQIVLQLLPNVAFRLPKGRRLLDVGSGPTIHVAMCFRDRIDDIYLSDFAQESRDEIRRWLRKDTNHFDWTAVTKFIALLEGNHDEWQSIPDQTRKKIRGVLPCNVFNPAVIRTNKPPNFDVVTTFFCLEAACNNVREYSTCIKNIVNLIKPGGYFVLGGLLDQSWYKTGGKNFKCVRLCEKDVFDALRESGIEVDVSEEFKYFNHEGIIFLVGRKKYFENKNNNNMSDSTNSMSVSSNQSDE